MKMKAEIGDEVFEIEHSRTANGIIARVNGTRYELEVSEPEPNVLVFKHDGKIYEVFADPSADLEGLRRFTINREEIEVRLIDPRRLRGAGGGDAAMDGGAEARAPMQGKVVTKLAAESTEANKGDGIIVVEAMKMQNELISPKNGVVREIRFNEGDTVAAGDVLAVID